MAEEKVQTWRHSRRGLIRGVIVQKFGEGTDDEWWDVEYVGDQRVSLISNFADPRRESGEVERVRASLMTEVED